MICVGGQSSLALGNGERLACFSLRIWFFNFAKRLVELHQLTFLFSGSAMICFTSLNRILPCNHFSPRGLKGVNRSIEHLREQNMILVTLIVVCRVRGSVVNNFPGFALIFGRRTNR